ncbi:transposase [Cytophagaceae bacterium BD1B2-1]|uniref:Transposase n=1 Tax=Xanthocytophaga agilis TaxID=3048010 RepID=A0AAE3UIZ8_9BACT|nr:transposase [Xanthocytophaga agilis]MDJ1505172.1 transposase [Xanthocytophaga agilis]
MKKMRFTESQIISILKQQEKGQTVAQIAREYGTYEPYMVH